jgi:hypothetical protein
VTTTMQPSVGHLHLRAGETHRMDCTQCNCQHARPIPGTGGTLEDPSSRCVCTHPVARHRFRPYDVEDPMCQAPGGRP